MNHQLEQLLRGTQLGVERLRQSQQFLLTYRVRVHDGRVAVVERCKQGLRDNIGRRVGCTGQLVDAVCERFNHTLEERRESVRTYELLRILQTSFQILQKGILGLIIRFQSVALVLKLL